MPRAGAGDGSSGPPRTGSSGFGGWLGGAARAMTGGGVGSGYVVLGGTRYGLRISQVTRDSRCRDEILPEPAPPPTPHPLPFEPWRRRPWVASRDNKIKTSKSLKLEPIESANRIRQSLTRADFQPALRRSSPGHSPSLFSTICPPE